MRAAVLEEFGKPLVVQEVDLADPAPRRGAGAAGRLRRLPHRHVHGLRRRSLGLCADGARPRGRRRGRGASARASARSRPGDHVVTLFSPQCGECIHCLSPKTNLCLAIREQQNLGYLPDGTARLSRDGEPIRHFMGTSTFAEYTVMPEIALAKISPGGAARPRLPVRLRALDRARRGDQHRQGRAGIDLRGVRRRHGRPRRRRRLPAAGRRADRVRRPLAGAARAGARPGRDRRHARRRRRRRADRSR